MPRDASEPILEHWVCMETHPLQRLQTNGLPHRAAQRSVLCIISFRIFHASGLQPLDASRLLAHADGHSTCSTCRCSFLVLSSCASPP